MKFKYFIIDNFITTDKQGLKDGVVIIKHLVDEPLKHYENGEGPFNSLRAIKNTPVYSRKYRAKTRKELSRYLKKKISFSHLTLLVYIQIRLSSVNMQIYSLTFYWVE